MLAARAQRCTAGRTNWQPVTGRAIRRLRRTPSRDLPRTATRLARRGGTRTRGQYSLASFGRFVQLAHFPPDRPVLHLPALLRQSPGDYSAYVAEGDQRVDDQRGEGVEQVSSFLRVLHTYPYALGDI